MFVLANKIDWNFFEKEFGDYYCKDNGTLALPSRLMVGIHNLVIAYNVSDECVVEAYIENGY
ncbi:MAG: hypothetical protein HQ521_13125 [Bacteroidetes bacterium]|nr:hypothetical protein [Bacteroidota bacterium]